MHHSLHFYKIHAENTIQILFRVIWLVYPRIKLVLICLIQKKIFSNMLNELCQTFSSCVSCDQFCSLTKLKLLCYTTFMFIVVLWHWFHLQQKSKLILVLNVFFFSLLVYIQYISCHIYGVPIVILIHLRSIIDSCCWIVLIHISRVIIQHSLDRT